MFEVVENAPDRLVLKLGTRAMHSTTYILDGTSHTARFERTLFGIRRKPIEVPFDQIAGLDPFESNGSTSVLLQLASGKRHWLSGDTPATTTTAVNQMRAFLGLPATQPGAAVKSLPRRYRWLIATASVLAGLAFIAVMIGQVSSYFLLPECDSSRAEKTVRSILAEMKLPASALADIKPLAETRTERVCQARAQLPGGETTIAYHVLWDGWTAIVHVTGDIGTGTLDAAKLDAAKQASDAFLDLAKESHLNGRPPRESDPLVKALLDQVFDVAAVTGTRLAPSEVEKGIEWFNVGENVGIVYILAGTGVSDINSLPDDATVRERTHRNVAEFATEFGRYLDFEIGILHALADAEQSRAKTTLRENAQSEENTKRVEDLRATYAGALTGNLTSITYMGLSDGWRRERIALLNAVAPTTVKFLSEEEGRALREHALKVVGYLENPQLQAGVKEFAEKFPQ
jgi:hypothetical protein